MVLSYGLALDVGLVVPLLGGLDLLAARNSASGKPPSIVRYAVFCFHACCSALALGALAAGMPRVAAIGLTGCCAAWAVTLLWFRRHPPAVSATAVVLVSPLSYVTAYPLLVAKEEFFRVAGSLIIGINVLIAVSVVLMIESTRLHAAWGCYPPSMGIADWNLGMCGYDNFWNPPLAPVCRTGWPTVADSCVGQLQPFHFFGEDFALAVHAGMLGLAVWVAAGTVLLLEMPPPVVSAAAPAARQPATTAKALFY